jgi:hypothetical protein
LELPGLTFDDPRHESFRHTATFFESLYGPIDPILTLQVEADAVGPGVFLIRGRAEDQIN